MKSIALPALGTGTQNFPRDKCAESISTAIQLFTSTTPHTSLKVIKVVVFHADQPSIAAFKKVFTRSTVAIEVGQAVGVISSLKQNATSAVSVSSNLVTTQSKEVDKANPKGQDANLATDSVHEDYVSLILYSFERRNILNAKRRIEKLVDENITSITTTRQSLTNLTRERKSSLIDYARSLNVFISIEEGGKVTITGCHEDTTKVLEYCHEIATNIVVEESHKEKGYLLAETVQWNEIASDGTRVEYDVSTNLKIKEASSKGENEIQLMVKDDHGIACNAKFDLKAMKVTSLKTGKVSKLERKKKGKGELF